MDGSDAPSLPCNVEAEQAVLGALLVSNDVIHRLPRLKPDHFYDPVHGRIFEVVCDAIGRGEAVSPITLKPIFDNDVALVPLGGAQYLLNLADAAITVFNVVDHAKIIIDMDLRRRMIRVGEDMALRARQFTGDESGTTMLASFEDRLFQMQGRSEVSGPRPFAQHLKASIEATAAAYHSDETIIGIPTGIRDLDRMLGGLGRGDVTIIAGRPSMGKSAFGRWITFGAAKAGRGALIVSMEMSGHQLSQRSISDALRRKNETIAYQFARKGFYDEARDEKSEAAFKQWVEAAREIERFPLEIDETAITSPASLRRSVARVASRMKAEHGELEIVLIDYLQLMDSDGRVSDNRVAELTRITKAIKQIAKFYNVHILVACQLSRKVEERDDKTPQLADLRESGSIEQDADNVIGIVRPEYYLGRKTKPKKAEALADYEADMSAAKNMVDLAVLKVRMGPVGMIQCRAELAYDWFDNISEKPEMPT